MDLKQTYNRIGDDWWRDHKDDDWWHEGALNFVSLLKKGGRILDVGCGGGLASAYLIGKGFDLTGIDFSEKMVEIASREVGGGKFVCMDMWDLEKLPEKFNGIYAKASILHLSKKKVPEIFKILHNKLASEGVLYVAVKEVRAGQKDEQVKQEGDFGYSYERFFSFFTIPEMEKYFTDSGFEIVYKRVTPLSKTTWIEIIGRKKNQI